MNGNDLRPAPTEDVPISTKEYKPSRLEALKDYGIRIQFLDRGCTVHVGCKTISFENVDSAMLEINNYVSNPWEAQQKWSKLLN
jgi:hypothetical protein